MFKNNLVATIKVGGKVLREFGDTVYVPFGSEYSILLKNLDANRKVKVSISIDGEDALDGAKLIINPNDSIDLKRFIRNGNLNEGNAFKFIEKTEKIEKYRGNKAEDGLVTISYEYERMPYAGLTSYRSDDMMKYHQDNIPRVWSTTNSYTGSSNLTYHRRVTDGIVASNCHVERIAMCSAGITAPGSITEQKFSKAYGFVGDGTTHRITLQLMGLVDGQSEVTAPVVVKKLKKCKMCGTKVKQVAKFCHECGSSVEIV